MHQNTLETIISQCFVILSDRSAVGRGHGVTSLNCKNEEKMCVKSENTVTKFTNAVKLSHRKLHFN